MLIGTVTVGVCPREPCGVAQDGQEVFFSQKVLIFFYISALKDIFSKSIELSCQDDSFEYRDRVWSIENG